MQKRVWLGMVCLFAATLWPQAWADGIAKGATYVAMGSSFAAGPGLTTRDPDSPLHCDRSVDNYAHLLARKRGLRLVDRTCSGATTADMLDRQQAGQPPQVEGLTPDTQLVTVTIGGNDLSYIGNLWAQSCINRPDKVPVAWKPFICRVTPAEKVQQAVQTLPAKMHDVVAQIRARAPKATIVFVSYVDILPATGSCPSRLPLTDEQLATARQLATQLVQITTEVANTEHTKLVAADRLTAGHDVCAADPWVFGFDLPTSPMTYAPIPYHPTAKSMAVVAEAIDRSL